MMKSFFYAAVLYLVFVIYGSLVPLDFRPIPLDKALELFKNIRYLNLGAASRADWVANILLYIPLAFLWSAAFGDVKNPFLRTVTTVVIITFCLALAVSIEFSQLFFPPRTVSINDLIAETIGTGIGVILWHAFGQYLIKQYKHISLGSFFSVRAAILFYLLAYLALSFFPFDFVTSFSELEAKSAGSGDHLFMAFDSCRQEALRCSVKLSVEILVILPLGILFSCLPYVTHRLILNVLIGFFLGVLVEGVQLFLISASGQGISILTRMLGMVAGAILYIWASKQNHKKWTPLFRPMVLVSILPYVVLVTAINGWMSGNWLNFEQALVKLGETRFLPFYYFYYTSESVALVSLLSNIGTYFPIGLMFWVASLSTPRTQKTHWSTVGLTAAGFATIVEAGKLFLAQKHADPTDVLIAFAAAAGSYVFLYQLMKWGLGKKTVYAHLLENREQDTADVDNHDANSQPIQSYSSSIERASQKADWDKCNETQFSEVVGFRCANPTYLSGLSEAHIEHQYEVRRIGRWVSLCLLAVIAWTLYKYPLGSIALTIFLILYGFLLFRFPFSWLLVLPALLPVMDFTPWTGWFFFDEFDLVVLTTLVFYFWQKPKRSLKPAYSITSVLSLCLFTIIYAVSLLKGLLPFQPVDANAFSNYYSHYNSLRVGKGFIWGLLLLPFLIQTIQCHDRAKFYFGHGILIGLSAMTIVSIMERFLFPGLFDYSTDFRIHGLFSTMHTGGGHIESYLVLTIPFIALLFLNKSLGLTASLLGFILFIFALYVLLMTFSRGGYFGLTAELVVLGTGLTLCFKNSLQLNWKPILLVFLSILVVPVIALPVFKGDLIQHRFSLVEQDKKIRGDHWHDAVNMMDQNFLTKLFGMGLGSYPRTYFLLNSENTIPATYKIESENGNNYLRLRGGDSLYFGQYINIEPNTEYRLSVDLRGEHDRLGLAIPICEKSLQYSFRCSSITMNLKSVTDHWQTIEQTINTREVGAKDIAGGLFSRPVQLALYNGNGPGKVVDVDNLRLIEASGKNLIANGDFSAGTDFWFFSTEKHHPWHILNLWVHILFDQGWLGLLAFALLLMKAFLNLFRHGYPDPFSVILLASITGFLVVGIVDSPFDAPRLSLLFFLILLFALIRYSNFKASDIRASRKSTFRQVYRSRHYLTATTAHGLFRDFQFS